MLCREPQKQILQTRRTIFPTVSIEKRCVAKEAVSNVERVITAAEVPEVLAATHEHTANFAVGFVKIEGQEDDALSAGSGTLITSGGRYAILTADHVLEA